MSETIDSLSIEIASKADAAVSNVDKLINKVKSLGNASNSATELANSIHEVSKAEEEAAGNAQKLRTSLGEVNDSGVEKISKGAEKAGKSTSSFLSRLKELSSKTIPAFGGAAKKMMSPLANFAHMLGRIAGYRILRTIIKEITSAFSEGIKNFYAYSAAINGPFAKSLDSIATSALYLKNALGTMFQNLSTSFAQLFESFVNGFVEVINWFNQLVATISGKSTYTAAKKYAVAWDDSAKKASGSVKNSAKEIKRTILGFDELNVLNGDRGRSSGSGSGTNTPALDYSKMFEERSVGAGFTKFGNVLEKTMQDKMNRIALIVSGASVAVGALLALTGVNVPLGIGLIAGGIIGAAATLDWSALDKETYQSIKRIIGIVSLGSVAVGAILALTGVNVPLGVTLLAAGAYGASKTLNWGDALSNETHKSLKGIISVVSLGAVAVGAILALSGLNVPLGITLLAAGAFGAAETVDWDSMKERITKSLGSVGGLIKAGSKFAFAVGMLLALSGIATPIGLALMAGSAGAMFAVFVNENWDSLREKIHSKLEELSKTFEDFKKKVDGFFTDISEGWKKVWGLGEEDSRMDIGTYAADTASYMSKLQGPDAVQFATSRVQNYLTSGIDSATKAASSIAKGLNGTLAKLFSGSGGSASKGLADSTDSAAQSISRSMKTIETSVTTTKDTSKSNLDELRNTFKTDTSSMQSIVRIGFASMSSDMKNSISGALNYMRRLDWWDVGHYMMSGLQSGLVSGANSVMRTLSNITSSIIKTTKSIFKIKSPSQVFRDEVGKMVGLGLAEGISDTEPAVVSRMNDMANALRGSVPALAGNVALNESIGLAIGAADIGGDYGTDGEGLIIDYAALGSAVASALRAAGVGAVYLDGTMISSAINRETRRLGRPAVTM